MSETQATRALKAAKTAFEPLEYDYVAGQNRIGEHAADAVGEDPRVVLKTLMIEVDGKPACVAIPVAASLSMKAAARAFGGKSATMMEPAKAERLTGFRTGGISPFGQKRRVPCAMEETVLDAPLIVLNGGQRGLMVRLAPADALAVAGATPAPLIA